jgi:molybdopterin converting factor small subunit
MRVSVIPSCTELIIIVNPAGEVTRKRSPSIIPGLYAPWPDAWEKGIIEIEVECETLIELLTKLSEQYERVHVDFRPVKPGTSSVDPDYDVYVNGKDYVTLPHGLDVKLTNGDEVVVRMV